jgi:hypothetical protein
MRHKGYKNGGGTATELTQRLGEQRRPATRIGRNHWHARKRAQMIMVPKRHDWDVIMLQGAAMREVYQRPRKPSRIAINSAKWFEKKENRVHIGSNTRRRRNKPGRVWN